MFGSKVVVEDWVVHCCTVVLFILLFTLPMRMVFMMVACGIAVDVVVGLAIIEQIH